MLILLIFSLLVFAVLSILKLTAVIVLSWWWIAGITLLATVVAAGVLAYLFAKAMGNG